MTPLVGRALLALLLAVAGAALALSFGSTPGGAVAALPLLAVAVPQRPFPPLLAKILLWTSRALVGAVAARGEDLALPLGLALVVLGSAFLVDPKSFPPGLAVLPAALGVLLGAAHKAVAPHFTIVAWVTATVLVLWLLCQSALTPRRVVSFLLLAVPSAALAHALIVFLPWAQPHVEEAAVEYITPNVAGSGLSIGARLGDVEELSLSKRVILRLWSEAPMNLRAGVFTRFDGRGWHKSKTVRAPRMFLGARLPLVPPSWAADVPGEWFALPDAVAAHPSFARFVVEERTAGVLPAPPGVDAARVTDGPVRLDAWDLVLAPPLSPETYTLRFTGRPAPEGDPGLAAESLELPPTVDARLSELAARLGAGATTPQDRIARTVRHLQSSYRYSLKVGRFRTSDPVAEFLFEKKKGYCEYFASATVLLLRLQGVPARYVNGLSVRDDNRRGDHYVVRAADAHAWAEALVPGVGWVEVDSTPPGDYEEAHPRVGGAFEEMLERLRAFFADLEARIRQGGWKELRRLISAAGRSALRQSPWLLVLYGIIRLARRLRRRPREAPRPRPASVSAPPELRACLGRVEVLWTRAGCPRPPHRGPLEHARSLPPERVTVELRQLSAEVVDCFYRGAYGGETVAPEEIARLTRALDELPTPSEGL